MTDHPTTLLQALAQRIQSPQAEFCRFSQRGTVRSISWSDLQRGAERYGSYFANSGIKPGDRLLIILPHSPDLFYSFIGAIMAGAIPSFMPARTDKQDEGYFWASHRALFSRIGAAALLTSEANLPSVARHLEGLTISVLASERACDVAKSFAVHHPRPEDTAFLQHSSGTTGLKKGVALSHRAVLAQVDSYSAALSLSASDRIASWLPLYHDMGLIACFLLPLITGNPVAMLDPFEWVSNPRLLLDLIKTDHSTLCWQPNFAFNHLCRTVRPSADLDLRSMRAWINCSEPCRADTFELFARKFACAGVTPAQLQVCYAMAETVFAVTQTDTASPPTVLRVDPVRFQTENRAVPIAAGEPGRALISAGKPIRGLAIKVVDGEGLAQSDGIVGEIAVAGNCLFSGYFNLPKQTEERLRQGWYYTGDLGVMMNGELFVTGRKDDLIIVHGRNYYAHDLEAIVNRVHGIHPGRCVAAGWLRPEVGSEEVVIIAECDSSEHDRRPQIAAAIKERILNESGLVVFDVHLVSSGWLVKTTSGKISRVENLNKYRAALAQSPAA